MDKNRDARFPDVNSFVKAVTSRSLASAPGAEQLAPRPQAAIATERVAREPSRTPVYLTFAFGVLVFIGFTVWKLKPREPDEPVLAPQATTTSSDKPSPSTTAPADKASADKPATDTDTPTAVAAPPAKTAEAKLASPRKAEAARSKQAALSPEAARDLDDAEAALAVGKSAEALRLAQHSLYAQKSSRAYAVIARARCAQGDLGNAKAALAQVAARERAAVVHACGKMGVELR